MIRIASHECNERSATTAQNATAAPFRRYEPKAEPSICGTSSGLPVIHRESVGSDIRGTSQIERLQDPNRYGLQIFYHLTASQSGGNSTSPGYSRAVPCQTALPACVEGSPATN